MKVLSLSFLVLFLAGVSRTQDSIPNAGFEMWTNPYTPEHWETTNLLIPPGHFTCSRTGNCCQGSWAIQLKTISFEGFIVPGVASLGHIGMGYTEGGVPFTGRPSAIKGWFRHPSKKDEVALYVQFFRNGEEIGGAEWTMSDSVPGYTPFTVPVVFTSPLTPDTINITILTDWIVPGSMLQIDGLEFEFPPVGMGYPDAVPLRIEVSPNPTSGRVRIRLPQEQLCDIAVYNLTGEVVLSLRDVRDEQQVDLTGVPSGVYLVDAVQGEARCSARLIRQ